MSFFKTLKNNLYLDLNLEDKNFKNILLQCAILGGLLFLSIFWIPLVFVTLICAGAFMCFQHDGKQLYFIIFLFPLISIFQKAPTYSNYLLAYLCILAVGFLGIKFIIDFFKKKTKVNWWFTGIWIAFIIFIVITANFSSKSTILSLILGLFLIYIAYVYRKDLNFKQIVLLFCYGLLFSIFIGLFNPASSRLNAFAPFFYDYGQRRFGGASSNPNILAGEVALALACILALFKNNEFKVLFWPLFSIFLITIIFTLSKAAFIITGSILLIFIVFYLIKNWNKKSIITTSCILALTIIILAIFSFRLKFLFDRFSEGIQTTTHQTANGNSTTTKVDMSTLSTGRTELWMQYFKEGFSSIQYAIIGHGVGAPFLGQFNGAVGFGPHNTFLQILYYNGLLGYAFIIGLMITAFDFKKIKQVKLHNLITICALSLFLFAIEFYSFRLSIYLIIIFTGLFYKNPKQIKEKEKVVLVEKK